MARFFLEKRIFKHELKNNKEKNVFVLNYFTLQLF